MKSKLCFLLLLTSFLFSFRLSGQPVTNVSQGYQLTSEFVDLLKIIDDDATRIRAFSEQAKKNPKMNDAQKTLEAIKTTRQAIERLNSHKLLLATLSSSQDTYIQRAAITINRVVVNLIKNYNDHLILLENLNNPPDVSREAILNTIMQVQQDRLSLLKTFLNTAQMVTLALLTDGPDNDGKLNYLTISAKERDSLKQTIEQYFGSQVKGGPKAGQSYLAGSASMVYLFLGQNFKTIEK
jgi:hypothetical protein